MRKKTFLKKTFPLIGVFLLLSSLLIPSVASALPTSGTTTPLNAARANNLRDVVAVCVQYSMRRVIYVDLANGEGDSEPSQHGHSGGDTGRRGSQLEWYADTMKENMIQPNSQVLNCAEATQELMDMIGIESGKTFLKDIIGFSFNSEDATWGELKGEDRLRNFSQNISIHPGYKAVTNLPVNAIVYAHALSAFTGSECFAENVVAWNTATAAQKALVGKTSEGLVYTRVSLADQEKDLKEMSDFIYSYKAPSQVVTSTPGAIISTTATDTPFGYFWRTRGAAIENSRETCPKLAEKVSETAKDMVSWAQTASQDAIDSEADSLVLAGGEGEGEDEASSCTIGYIGWILCPTVNFLAGMADNAYSFLAENFLTVPISTLDQGGATFEAWKIFQNIANILLVILFLVIVFSQLTSVGITNYGIKKLLPKLIIVAILMNLSFVICAIAVDLSNILGYGLNSVLSSVAGGVQDGAGISEWSKTGGDQGGVWSNLAIGVLAGGSAAAGVAASGGITLALVALIPAVFAAAMALIMIFFILVARQALIILLIAIAPLAFALYLLPNTSKWFSKWGKTFVSLLMVFPIIGLVYGTSTLASTILKGVYADSSFLGEIISAGIMLIPLLVVPSLLRKSLDSVGNIGGMMGKLNAKMSGGLQNKMSNSGFNKHLQGKSALQKATVSSGVYNGKNPFKRARSAVNRGLNKSSAFNALSQGYGQTKVTQGAKIASAQTRQEVEDAGDWIDNYRYTDSSGMERALSTDQKHDIAMGRDVVGTNIKSGDVSTAQRKAAMGQLAPIMTQTQANELAKASSTMTDASLRDSTAAAIAQKAAKEGGHLGGPSLEMIRQGTYNEDAAVSRFVTKTASPEQLAAQSADALELYNTHAKSVGADPLIASTLHEHAMKILGNDELKNKLSVDQKKQIDLM